MRLTQPRADGHGSFLFKCVDGLDFLPNKPPQSASTREMKSMKPKVLVVIPAYNEAGVIGKVVREIRKVMAKDPCGILVIDDGSRDGTAAEARSAGARVISQIQNMGYGYALKTGYQVAHAEGVGVVVQMDGDGQHAPASIPGLMAPVLSAECDLVIGSRALSDTHYPMPLARRIGQRVFSGLLYRMGGLRIHDATSGFQVIGPGALRQFVSADFPGDYPDTNVLLHLKLKGVRILEMPAEFRVSTSGKSMHSGLLKPAYYAYSMTLSMMMVYWRHWMAGKHGGQP